MIVERAPAAELLARADAWLEQTRADGELRAGWSRPTDALLVLGSAQRLEAPGGAAVRRSTGGGAVSCDDHYLMLDVVLPRGHALVIDDVGQSYRWLADALRTALEARGAALRAVTPREAAGRSAAERAAARLACFAGTGSYELLTSDGRKLVGLAQRRRGGAALLQAAAYIDAPRIDVAARLGLPRDEEAQLRERLARIATLAEVAPGFADAPDVVIP